MRSRVSEAAEGDGRNTHRSGVSHTHDREVGKRVGGREGASYTKRRHQTLPVGPHCRCHDKRFIPRGAAEDVMAIWMQVRCKALCEMSWPSGCR
jgi:hypothetical protein